jgi:hypothetical protein
MKLMGNAMKIVQISIYIVLFCAGIYVLISEEKTYVQTLEIIRENIKDNELYQQYTNTDRETIGYSEIISSLLNPLEYDVMVDSIFINKDTHGKDKIEGYGINRKSYKKSYEYDDYGNITTVIYTGINWGGISK